MYCSGKRFATQCVALETQNKFSVNLKMYVLGCSLLCVYNDFKISLNDKI